MQVKNFIWKFFRRISSLRFSIGILLLLAFVSIVGTIIEQDRIIDYYKSNYPEENPILFIITWKQIVFLGLDHVYSTPWFLILLFIFFLSLAICTFSTQLPMFKHARQWSFLYNSKSLKKKDYYNQTQSSSVLNFIYALSFKNYYIFHQGKTVYAYKGILGRIAPIFVHISIILTLIGSLFGFTNGFMAQEMVPSGEIFHIQNIIKTGHFSKFGQDFVCKVNDFFILFNEDKSIQQFFSDIDVLSNRGSKISNKLVSVNLPLKFHGFTFYQTDWQINAIRIKIGSNTLLVKNLKKIKTNTSNIGSSWICNLILDNNQNISIVVPDLLDHIDVYNSNGVMITTTQYGVRTIIYGTPIVFKDLISSSGLQVKIDPGIIIAYLGFLILMISIVISYISYSEIWASNHNKTLNFSGSTNRAFLGFEDELLEIYKNYIVISSLSR